MLYNNECNPRSEGHGVPNSVYHTSKGYSMQREQHERVQEDGLQLAIFEELKKPT